MDPAQLTATRAAIEAAEPVYDEAPPFSDADLERALAAADVLRAGGDGAAMVAPQELAALSPDEAGRLVADLAVAGRVDALVMVVTATPPHRYPIATLLRMAAALPHDCTRGTCSSGPSPWRPRSGCAPRSTRWAPTPRSTDVLTQVATVRTVVAAETPYRWWVEPEMAMAEPHGQRQRPRAGERRRARRDRAPRPRRRRHPEVLPPPRRRGLRAAGRRRDRPALRDHRWASSSARTRSWCPARRWSSRWARPSSWRSCCSTTRRRSRSPAARARTSPSPTCSPTRR